MREEPEEPISRRHARRELLRWTRIHLVYLLPNGHRWRTRTVYQRRTSNDQEPVKVRYLCALHPHIEMAALQPPVDYTLPGVVRYPHPERPGRFLVLFCPECCGAGYHRLSFPMPDPNSPRRSPSP